jgi:four helix bundle protein
MGDKESEKPRTYDLEDRSLKYARAVIGFVKDLPTHVANREIIKQLIRAGCSVGANYIEANESLGKKDFAMRIKICRKEAKESKYWLLLIETGSTMQEIQRNKLMQEAEELKRIFSAILLKTKP